MIEAISGQGDKNSEEHSPENTDAEFEKEISPEIVVVELKRIAAQHGINEFYIFGTSDQSRVASDAWPRALIIKMAEVVPQIRNDRRLLVTVLKEMSLFHVLLSDQIYGSLRITSSASTKRKRRLVSWPTKSRAAREDLLELATKVAMQIKRKLESKG